MRMIVSSELGACRKTASYLYSPFVNANGSRLNFFGTRMYGLPPMLAIFCRSISTKLSIKTSLSFLQKFLSFASFIGQNKEVFMFCQVFSLIFLKIVCNLLHGNEKIFNETR